MARKLYAYSRLSSSEQTKGHGATRQLEGAEAYAKQLGIPIDAHFRDLGRSAKDGDNFDRGALGELVALVEAGKIEPGSVLYVENLDRLSREVVPKALVKFLTLLEAGLEIYTGMDRRHYTYESITNSQVELIASIMIMSRAWEESATKSDRISKKWAARRADAAKGPMTKMRPYWLDWDEKTKWFVENEHAGTVRRIFKETAELGFGKELIAKRFNREGVPLMTPDTLRRGSIGWHGGAITHILKSRNTFGEYQPRTCSRNVREPIGDAIPGYYPAVITRDLFDKAQAVTAANHKTGGRKGNQVQNLFSGKVFCKECGSRIRVRTGRNLFANYVCDQAYRGTPVCSNRVFTAIVPLERGIMDASLIWSGVYVPPAEDNQTEQLSKEIGKLRDRITHQRKKLDALGGDDSDSEIVALAQVMRKIGAEIQDMEKQLAEKETELTRVNGRGTIGEHIEVVRKLREAAHGKDREVRFEARAQLARAMREIVTRIEIDETRTASVSCRDGALTFKVQAGECSDLVFKVNEQFWRLNEDTIMTQVAA